MLRLGLALLAVFHLFFGVPAIVAPQWFFDNFPGAGHRWTAAYQPYNEHLMTDVGAAFTTLGVILAMAAVMMDRRVTNVVLIGLLVFSALHLAYHTGHHGALPGGELAASLVSLAAGVLAPIALLWLNRRRT
jgi:hypothetical protein